MMQSLQAISVAAAILCCVATVQGVPPMMQQQPQADAPSAGQDRACQQMMGDFSCRSTSDIKLLKKLKTVQSTVMHSGMNPSETFQCHRQEFLLLCDNSGSKVTVYKNGTTGEPGTFSFVYKIGANQIVTQLYAGAPKWTPFAVRRINGIITVFQCYGENLEYTDMLLGVQREPTDADYKRSEAIMQCMNIPDNQYAVLPPVASSNCTS